MHTREREREAAGAVLVVQCYASFSSFSSSVFISSRRRAQKRESSYILLSGALILREK